jgi:L-alanine-DL-glutamate epimerase-like enolase superfamily enzyme
MRLFYRNYELPFEYPFTISKGTKTHQPTLVVALEFRGLIGYGEAPAISYYDVTVDSMIRELEAKKMMVEKYAFTEPERYWHFLHHLFPKNQFLVCALDMAYWDLFAKSKRKPLYKFFTESLDTSPLTDYTIGIDSIESMVSKLNRKPWPIYKVKVGTPDDLQVVTELRKHTEGSIRVDANAGWTLDQAIVLIPKLHSLGVEFIEQPLAKDDINGMKTLFEQSESILVADESCVYEKDVEACVGQFHGINIKLTKCGGITPAVRMIRKAKELGLKVMLGSMNESTIGSAAIVHLSGMIDYMDCDGPLLLSEDIASGLVYNNGHVQVSEQPGLGVRLFDDIVSL